MILVLNDQLNVSIQRPNHCPFAVPDGVYSVHYSSPLSIIMSLSGYILRRNNLICSLARRWACWRCILVVSVDIAAVGMGILRCMHAGLLPVVSILLLECVTGVLILHRIRLRRGRSIGGWGVVVVCIWIVLVVLVVGHPAGTVHWLHTSLSATA